MLAAANDPTSSTQLIWGIVFVGVAIRAFSRLRDPEWNGKAALSLGLTASVVTAVNLAVASTLPAAMMAAALLAIMVLPAALVLGVLALRELRRGEVRALGRRYAIWSFVFILLVGGGVAAGVRNVFHKQTASPIDVLQVRFQPSEGSVIERHDANLRVRMPRGWKQLEAKSINKEATLAFGREGPETYAMIIAEDSQGTLDTTQLAAVWRGLVESKGATVAAAEPLRIGGFDGLRMHASLRQGMWQMVYSTWVVSRRGFLYQIAVWSKKVDESGLDGRAEEILRAFEQLDPLRESSQLLKPVGPFSSPHFGYSVDLGPAWSQWKGRGSSWPSLEFGALCGSTDGIGAYALSLAGENPPIEQPSEAMLERVGIPRKAPSRRRRDSRRSRPSRQRSRKASRTGTARGRCDPATWRSRSFTGRRGPPAIRVRHAMARWRSSFSIPGPSRPRRRAPPSPRFSSTRWG